MTFVMTLCVILLSVIMILLFALSVIRHLICGKKYNWFLNLNLIYEGRKWFIYFNAGKTQLVSFNRSNNTGAINVKMDVSVLEEKSYFKMQWLAFCSKLDRGSYIISISKGSSKKLEP